MTAAAVAHEVEHVATTSWKLRRIWNQGEIPVLLRRGHGERPRLRLPYDRDNQWWLLNGRRNFLSWDHSGRYWEIPASWFNDLVNRALERFGKVYVLQPYRESEKCAPACMNAMGHECECSCMGANHGAGNDGSWFEVSETFAVRWGEREIACRLLTAKSARH